MNFVVRMLKLFTAVVCVLSLSACASEEPERRGSPETESPPQATDQNAEQASDSTEEPPMEFGDPPRKDAVTADDTEHRGDAEGAVGYPEGTTDETGEEIARPETPVQGQRPYELLLTAGVELARIEELAQNNFPTEGVRSAVRESMLARGEGEEEAGQKADEIAQWIEDWTREREALLPENLETPQDSGGNDPSSSSGNTNDTNDGWDMPPQNETPPS